MIVTDVNILTYLLIKGDKTLQAQAVWQIDADWVLPDLWRDEFLISSPLTSGKAEQTSNQRRHFGPQRLICSRIKSGRPIPWWSWSWRNVSG